MSIPSHILEQLNSQADLLGMIGRHTTLKRSGGTYRGKCPFHKGNSNSFSVNPQKNLYHCFKCHASGNAFSFLKDYENLTFMEAVNELSKQTGIEVPKEDNQALRYKRKPVRAVNQSNQNNRSNSPPPNATRSYNPNNSDTGDTGSHSNASHQQLVKSNNNPSNIATDIDSSDSEYGYGNMPPMPDGYMDMAQYENDALIYHPSYDNSTADFHKDSDKNQNSVNNPDSYGVSPDASGMVVQHTAPQDGNLYDLLENVAAYYQNNLYTHAPALRYFKSRDLTEATIQLFGLGYAPAGWQHLEQAFAADVEGLKALGLIRRSEKGRDYNLLRDRVIFPIRDNQGRVIGFAGRALDNEVKPKYINSSDSPVFHKQHVLYGYYESRQQRAKDWLVVEGYMDVIALYQAGIYGAVASMGTSINEGQIARLLQFNPTLTLSFDGDSAGQSAAWRTLEVALPALTDDKELRFLTLPGEHDPDTYIGEHGVDAMREQIASAMPLSQYIFAYLSERYDLSMAEGKAKLMAQVRELTNRLPKGSSFKYLLNNDIYQKLGGRKSKKTITAHDALIDFNGEMTRCRQLQLCLLFEPTLLQDDPIVRLWEQSGVTSLPLPKQLTVSQDGMTDNQNTPKLPELPSWQHFGSSTLTTLATRIPKLISYLPEDTNARAHFILATLPPQTQQRLAKRWQPFWANLNDRGIEALDQLCEDLLAQLMLQALGKQMNQANHIVIKSHINRQQQTLSNWHKKRLAEQATKVS